MPDTRTVPDTIELGKTPESKAQLGLAAAFMVQALGSSTSDEIHQQLLSKLGIKGHKNSLNAVLKAPPARWFFRTPSLGTRHSHHSYAEWEFQHAPDVLAMFSPYDDISGKSILDIGCGLGGKSTWYALNGASTVTALDADAEKIEAARAFAAAKGAVNARFDLGSTPHLPYEPASFDLVSFNDSFEHIAQPGRTLHECRRLLKRGGRITVTFPPADSPWGAHLFVHVRIPWAPLFFPEEDLLELWKEAFNRDLENGTGIYSKRRIEEINAARSLNELAHLNGMTVRKFEQLIEDTALNPRLLRYRTPRGLFSFLTRFPSLREYVVSPLVAVLEKQE